MFILFVATFEYLIDKNVFSICFILCFLLLIPKIANYLNKRFKINRIIKYILIIIIFFIGVSYDSQINENQSVENDNVITENNTEENNIIEMINNNISSTYKYRNVNLKKVESKYIVTIPLQRSYTYYYSNSLWCGIDAISIINNIKYFHYTEVDEKVSKYIFEFYIDDKLGYTAEVINTSDKKLNQITLYDTNMKSTIITQERIDKFLADLEKEKEELTKFDENNIDIDITCNNKKVTIKKIKRVTKKENKYVPSGDEWIGIYIVWENQSKEDMYYSETDFNLVNQNGEIIKPSYAVIKGVLDRDRLNNGTLTSGGKKEGYVIFSNNIINDKELSLRFTCENNFIKEDVIETVELY